MNSAHGDAVTVGVDIGGTKIAAGTVSRSGELGRSKRAATPTQGAEAVLDTVAELVDDLGAGMSVAGVGVASPGIIDPLEGVVTSATAIVPGWQGARVCTGLTRRTGRYVAVENDVRVMALGESLVANTGTARDALHVSVGTGIGGALLRDGRLVRGARGSAGEIAHLTAPGAGRIPCGCGRTDHIEAVAAGPAIAAEYAYRQDLPKTPELPEVVARMRAGDTTAHAAIADAAGVLGHCVAGLVTAVDLDAVVIGGGVAQIGPEFVDPFAEGLRSDIRPRGRSIPILPATLGTNAPIIGAGLLAWQSTTAQNGDER